jgi:hypothetical protein
MEGAIEEARIRLGGGPDTPLITDGTAWLTSPSTLSIDLLFGGFIKRLDLESNKNKQVSGR